MDRISSFLYPYPSNADLALEAMTVDGKIFRWDRELKDPDAKKLRESAKEALKLYKGSDYQNAIAAFKKCKESAYALKQKIAAVEEPVDAKGVAKDKRLTIGKQVGEFAAIAATLPVSVPVLMVYTIGQLAALSRYKNLDLHFSYDDSTDGVTVTKYQDALSRESTNDAKREAQLICNRFIAHCDKYIKLCEEAARREKAGK